MSSGAFPQDRSQSLQEQGGKKASAPISARPFGVHIRMQRWKSLIVLIAVPVILLVAQIVIFQFVTLIEGPADPLKPALTPLTILAVGLSTGLAALIITALTARLANVPWQSLFRHNRPFDWRRLRVYLLGAAVLVAIGGTVTRLVAPESTGTGAIEIGTTTLLIILLTLVAIPLQSAGEEVLFRGAVVPAAGSWFRGVRSAIAFGMIVSGVLFALVHVSVQPWFVSYLLVFSACTVVMGLISGGLEAAIAFHVANNVLAGIANAVYSGNGADVLERGVDSGPGPAMIILMLMNVAVVIMVWLIERAKRSPKRSDPPAGGSDHQAAQ
ncbi:CPBP family intramembrane glutamic endopeptidase [Arthrobacter crusticola]|nr:type II CAAX endopeptidase family protein [Arthrobacter crusticola]